MTIYATPFTDEPRECTGPSTDSGFQSLDEVVEVMGPDYVTRSRAMVIYGPGNDRVVFSRIIFRIDDDGSNA